MIKSLLKRALPIMAICVAGAVSANAVGRLILDDGTTVTTVIDGSAGDANTEVGAVTFVGAFGVWNINVSTGVGRPVIGSVTAPELDLGSVNHSTAAGTLKITWQQSGFNFSGDMNAGIGGTTDGTVVYEVQRGIGTVLASVGPFSDGVFAGEENFNVSGDSLTLKQIVTITHSGEGITSFNASLGTVPDGGMTAMLLGLALSGIALIRRKL